MEINKEEHHTFHSYCYRPRVSFEMQQPHETVILLLRAHPITQLPWILNSVMLLTLLFLLNFILPNFINPVEIIFADIFIFSVVIAYVWFNFLGWYFNVGIVTNTRVVDVDFDLVIYKEITSTNLKNIEDVTAKSGGFNASVFDYGNVFVQTAGTEVNIEFLNVPHPTSVVKIINQLANSTP